MTTYYGVDYEKITVSNTVTTLDADKVAAATRAVIVVEAAATKHMRMRYDNGDPTASVGARYTDGQSFTLEGRENLEHFKAIRAEDTDIVLHVNYESPDPADIPA